MRLGTIQKKATLNKHLWRDAGEIFNVIVR